MKDDEFLEELAKSNYDEASRKDMVSAWKMEYLDRALFIELILAVRKLARKTGDS